MDYDGYVSLADFGLAKFLQPRDQTYSFCGTAEYLAPEILDMRGHGFGVDWWTLGILLYEMATGRPPFLNKSHHKLGILIRTGRIVFPDPEKHQIYMSEDLKDIILKVSGTAHLVVKSYILFILCLLLYSCWIETRRPDWVKTAIKRKSRITHSLLTWTGMLFIIDKWMLSTSQQFPKNKKNRNSSS